jgi:membrane fusion protein, multidrug efflux system
VRAEKLIASKTISSREYDAVKNAVGETAARVQAAKAALDAAKIALGHTDIVAPVGGRVSRSELTVGNVVSAGVSAPLLATLVSVSPIYASFEVDEQAYLRYLRRDAGRTVPVVMGLADEDGYPRTGLVVSIDNHLDVGSGTILVRAKFDNADGSLIPGLYARLRISGGSAHPAVLVDDSVIGTDQAKKYVLIVDPTNHVKYREVRIGELQDGYRVIDAGLEPGERIVVRGIQRVRPNDLVQPNLVQMAAAGGQAVD